LKKAGLRAEVDDGSERMQAKIRAAQTQKIPYMLVIGDKEMEQGAVALRLRSGEAPGPMPVEEFIQRAKEEVEAKA
jgi:threonyl-tRNA synthetase